MKDVITGDDEPTPPQPSPDGSIPHPVAVVGASAGGVAALQSLVAAIPETFSGVLCVVLHLAPPRPSSRARIRAGAGATTGEPARDGEPLEPGCAYVAPPDRHLVVVDGHIRL